jgi:hypothetical protein
MELQHFLDELVDLLTTVTCLSTLKVVKKLGLAGESSKGRRKLERPQEVVCLLEVRSNGTDLVDEVSTAVDSEFSESLLDYGVISDRNALLVDLSESTLVYELLDGSTGRDSVGYIRLDETKHADGSSIQLNKG